MTKSGLGGSTAKRLRILVIDSNDDVRDLLKRELEMMQYSVLTASDGLTGLELAKQERPDVIISSIKVLMLNGYDLMRKIREIPELASIPAIALTGMDAPGCREKAYAAGYSLYITKPIDPDKLHAMIEKLVARRDKK